VIILKQKVKISEIKNNQINDSLLYSIFYSSKKSKYDSVDFMIIFGCHIKEFLDERINYAINIKKNKQVNKIIVSGGIGLLGDFNESEYMIEKLVQNGVDRNKIIVENTSRTTEENVSNCTKILENLSRGKYVNVLLVSHQYHLRRIHNEFKKSLSFQKHNLLLDWPEHSLLSYKNIIENQKNRKIIIEEVERLVRYAKENIIEDEEIIIM